MINSSVRHWIGALAAVLLLAAGASLGWHFWSRPEVRAAHLLAQARRASSARDYSRAEELASAGLNLDPALGDAALLAAECAAAKGQFQRAVEYLHKVAPDEPQSHFRALVLTAQLEHHQRHRLGDAEQAYRAALALEPDNVAVNDGLARLLGLCGRGREAIPHALVIVRHEQPTDLLVLLARIDGVANEPGALEAAAAADPADPNTLLGRAWHAAAADETDGAIGLLRDAVSRAPSHVAAQVALGRQLLEARRFDELVRWAEQVPSAADEASQTWVIRARMAENDGDVPAAIRCYWESLRREPESKSANAHLARLLAQVGRAADCARFAGHVRRLQALEAAQNRALFSNDGGTGQFLELVNRYEAAGRFWEAYGWCQEAVRLDPQDESAQHKLQALRRQVAGSPLKLTANAQNPALAIDLSTFPLPRFRKVPAAPSPAAPAPSSALSFRDDAASAGLVFRFDNGTDGQTGHRMFEFTGGGIAVLDFDLDGYPDVFFTQGRPYPFDQGPPEQPANTGGDRLFWNQGGTRFVDVTGRAGFRGTGFGQGVAVGDVNADGFPDLYAAHIGANELWQNNGDGTLNDVTPSAGVRGKADDWTTSCIMADLSGDGLPDIYVANYVTAPDVFERICRRPDGAPKICMPFDFEAQPDHLWINDGKGGFVEAGPQVLGLAEGGKGLGLAAWDPGASGRLSLLVANDTTPNFFLVSDTGSEAGSEKAETGQPRWRDRGFETGLAVDGEGKAKGCMGIALADVNDDGRLDVHITNFLNESSTFYQSRPDGTFDDRTREAGLQSSTIDLVGFGTQFLDADLDGRLELFMTSGHIDDFRNEGKPYKMPAKLFRWNSQRFVEVDPRGLGPYFRKTWLGRSVARIDWNRDGRDDLIVGHLFDETALLTNTTPATGGSLSLRLVGVQSNRDAIGTTVQIRIGERNIFRQLTAGDGYQAGNERRLIFGLGEAQQVDEMIVQWPSGIVQQFTDIPASSELQLTEGRSLVALPARAK